MTAAVVLAIGCQLGPGTISPSPLSYKEQEQAILQRVPPGTPRGEAVQKLREAGIDGSFGLGESIYYCDIWNRPDGRRWHLDVALLFNESGELYETRPGNAEVGVWRGGKQSGKTGASGGETRRPAEADETTARPRRPSRGERRRPFAEAPSFP